MERVKRAILVYWILLLCWTGSTLSQNPTWSANQHMHNASHAYAKLSAQSSPHLPKLCQDSRCSCSHSSQTGARNVSCQCSPQDQEASLNVHPSSVPGDVSHVVIQSCRSVVFHESGLKNLHRLSILTVIDVGEVVFHPGSFNQFNVERETIVTIGRCRQLAIKSGSFISHPLGPVSVFTSDCHSVQIEELAFSRLSRLALANIQLLHLASQAFRFATGSPAAADHIRTEIIIEHATMTDIKSFTFPSPLDRLQIENVTVSGQIESNTCSALRIVQLIVRNSRIGSIATAAFSEFTHLDCLEIRSTRIDQIAGRAFASAASSLIIEGCQIGRMNQSALNMPVARVTLAHNQIKVLAKGALYLREWNELLIENNTIALVERHAFYNIGEPQLVPTLTNSAGKTEDNVNVRFVIRGNVFHQVQQGAFIINAQVPQLKLEENYFKQDCDCQMSSWAGQLTQITRRTETTISDPFVDEPAVPDALWLGSSLYNSSSCWLDAVAADCLAFSQPTFLSMNNYTDEFCTAQRKPEISRCMAVKRSFHDIHRMAVDFQSDDGSGIKLVSFNSRQDLVMVVVLGVSSAFVLLAVCLGLIVARFRNKTRRQDRSGAALSAEERVTCSPLISNPNAEKQLGSGVVSSGSISRLSVKEYRNYLEELGPIYSEPVDPPDGGQYSTRQSTSTLLLPPQVPAMPVQWTPKSGQRIENGNDKRTIDRGTQTLEEAKVTQSEDNSASVHFAAEPTSSLALEFTEDVLAALKDKMDISPMYSEVKDSILSKETVKCGTEIKSPDLYDLINVVDTGQRPSTASSNELNHIYCKPWSVSSDPSKSPSLCVEQGPTTPTAQSKNEGEQQAAKKTVKSSSSSLTSASKTPSEGVKNQPFHVRGSLPKWPPPVRDVKPTSRNRNNGVKVGSPISSQPASPTKETKTFGAPSFRSTPAKKTKASPRTGSETSASQKGQRSSNAEETSNQNQPQSNRKQSTVEQPLSHPQVNEEYAEVTAQPFSFSFRRPLFADRQSEKSATRVQCPPDPSKAALLSEYADPRDLNEPLYSELIIQEDDKVDRPPVI